MSAIARLAEFITTAEPDPALSGVIAPAVADCFGCILAGSDSEVSQRATAALAEFGAGSVPLYGRSLTVSAPLAAQLNAVAGHAWDLDDWEEPGNTHPTVVLLPALLAAGHIRKASGADLFAACAIGVEVIMRLGMAMSLDHYARGFHSTATLGTIGVAAGCTRLLGLDREQTGHALALSVSQACGYTLQFGSNAKPLQAGWAARGGFEAAFLAAQNVTAQPHVLDNPRGFAGLMGVFDAGRFEAAIARPGDPWALEEYGLVLKPWPSCGYTHRLMTAALDLRPALAGRLSEVTSVAAELPDFHAEILPFMAPDTRNEALFSAPACIAQVLIHGNLTLQDSENSFWQDPEVALLIARTTVKAVPAQRPDMNYDPEQPDVLRVNLSSGEVLQARCATPLGAVQSPMNRDQLAAKFADLTGRPPSVFHHLLTWPEASDIAGFFKGEHL